METYYLVTIYENGKARYVKTNIFAEAMQICEESEFARVQEKRTNQHGGCSKYICEKYNGIMAYNQ